MCQAEVVDFAEREAEFEAENGIDVTYVVVLFENDGGHRPDDDTAADYAADVGVEHEYPILSDRSQEIIEKMPWSGSLPGKCAMSPDMEMLECWSSAQDTRGFNAIVEHAGGGG